MAAGKQVVFSTLAAIDVSFSVSIAKTAISLRTRYN